MAELRQERACQGQHPAGLLEESMQEVSVRAEEGELLQMVQQIRLEQRQDQKPEQTGKDDVPVPHRRVASLSSGRFENTGVATAAAS